MEATNECIRQRIAAEALLSSSSTSSSLIVVLCECARLWKRNSLARQKRPKCTVVFESKSFFSSISSVIFLFTWRNSFPAVAVPSPNETSSVCVRVVWLVRDSRIKTKIIQNRYTEEFKENASLVCCGGAIDKSAQLFVCAWCQSCCAPVIYVVHENKQFLHSEFKQIERTTILWLVFSSVGASIGASGKRTTNDHWKHDQLRTESIRRTFQFYLFFIPFHVKQWKKYKGSSVCRVLYVCVASLVVAVSVCLDMQFVWFFVSESDEVAIHYMHICAFRIRHSYLVRCGCVRAAVAAAAKLSYYCFFSLLQRRQFNLVQLRLIIFLPLRRFPCRQSSLVLSFSRRTSTEVCADLSTARWYDSLGNSFFLVCAMFFVRLGT